MCIASVARELLQNEFQEINTLAMIPFSRCLIWTVDCLGNLQRSQEMNGKNEKNEEKKKTKKFEKSEKT